MRVIDSAEDLRASVASWRNHGKKIGFVPTMGYLHDGHLGLADTLRALHPDIKLVASIYVNPTQFGPNEDLDRYPSDREGDLSKLRARGIDVVFFPSDTTMYPNGVAAQRVSVRADSLQQPLCGAGRPVHFGGVLMVVSKLFNLVQPDYAAFGEKDFQQLRLIETLVEDLAFPVQIVRGPTVREADGLAMSSRNANLSSTERSKAPALHRALKNLADALPGSAMDPATVISTARIALEEEISPATVEYLELRDENTLQPASTAQPGQATRLFVAANFSAARLIDNQPVHLPAYHGGKHHAPHAA